MERKVTGSGKNLEILGIRLKEFRERSVLITHGPPLVKPVLGLAEIEGLVFFPDRHGFVES